MSAAPAAVDALVAVFKTLAGVTVFDGPATEDTSGARQVYVGLQDPLSEEGKQPAVDGEQSWHGMTGATQREETFTVHCAAVAWSGGTDMKATRDDAYALMAAAENAILADLTLGVTDLWTTHLARFGHEVAATSRGLLVQIRFDVECKAILTGAQA